MKFEYFNRGDIMKLSTKQKKIGLVLLGLSLILYFLWPIIAENEVSINKEVTRSQPIKSSQSSSDKELSSIRYVYLTGAVSQPGLYNMEEGAKLHDLIEGAGGFLPYADVEGINLAEEIEPGSHVHVHFNFNGNPEALLRKQKINLNTASLDELKSLPGIGEAMAKRIDEYRQKEGAFMSIEDLKKIKGIGNGLMEKLSDKVTI